MPTFRECRKLAITSTGKDAPISTADHDKASAELSKTILKAWHDPAFRAKLKADPHAALKGAGITIPVGMIVKYVEDNPTHVHLVIDLAIGATTICLGSVWIRLVLDSK